MNKLVREYLFSPTQIETEQLKHNTFVNDLPESAYESLQQDTVLLKEFFLKNDTVYISKHPRFSDYPEHRHHFLELNYVLSGHSEQIINGKHEVIKEGEMLLLDRDSSHSLKRHDENDILINLIFPNEKIDVNWLSSISSNNNILFSFLAHTMASRSKKQYLIFRCAENEHVQAIMDKIIDIYFTEPSFANEIITLYIPILFTELIGNCRYDYYHAHPGVGENNEVVINTLRLIENEFASITLEKAAKQLGYNKNYLSNIIKKKTGTTFSQLLTEKRMRQAKFLLESTELPITQIIEKIGLTNKSFFYTHFKKNYGYLPTELRKSTKER